ncbi:MAG: DUF5721 family protein [Clostridiales bacterium]|jgi:hypothetical protein|nr:DUF5721 family protein [Clostridiales bacterium]
MIFKSLKDAQVKQLMRQLLKGDAFDNFLVRGVEVKTFTTFSISGATKKRSGQPATLRSFAMPTTIVSETSGRAQSSSFVPSRGSTTNADNDDSDYDFDQHDGAYCAWSALRPYVLKIITGLDGEQASRPGYIKIVFAMPDENARAIHKNSAALFLNLVYEHDVITLSTGSSQRSFSLDKSVGGAWDNYVEEFLKTRGWT